MQIDRREADKTALKAELLATRKLGEEPDTERRIIDLLPKVIAERVKQIIPDDFELAELELKFEVQGKLFGAGVGGEVVAKLKSKSSKASG